MRITAPLGPCCSVSAFTGRIYLSIGGASWSLSSRPTTAAMPALLHMALMVGLALMGTVPIYWGEAGDVADLVQGGVSWPVLNR